MASTPLHRHPAWLAVAGLLAAAALAVHGPIAQWSDYHAFADARPWLGVPNAANVLSNVVFALVGVVAWRRLDAVRDGPAFAAWRALAAALVCTAVGSAVYHWAPSNAALVLDRLPIAWACAAIACALLAERVDRRFAASPALAAALVLASASVAWWWRTEQGGAGDLRPYLYVQFLPVLLVVLVSALRLAPVGADVVAERTWWLVIALYALAKLAELADRAVFDVLPLASGHTLKHLLAAAAGGVLLHAAARRGQRLYRSVAASSGSA